MMVIGHNNSVKTHWRSWWLVNMSVLCETAWGRLLSSVFVRRTAATRCHKSTSCWRDVFGRGRNASSENWRDGRSIQWQFSGFLSNNKFWREWLNESMNESMNARVKTQHTFIRKRDTDHYFTFNWWYYMKVVMGSSSNKLSSKWLVLIDGCIHSSVCRARKVPLILELGRPRQRKLQHASLFPPRLHSRSFWFYPSTEDLPYSSRKAHIEWWLEVRITILVTSFCNWFLSRAFSSLQRLSCCCACSFPWWWLLLLLE
jgi:hypothetical protein